MNQFFSWKKPFDNLVLFCFFALVVVGGAGPILISTASWLGFWVGWLLFVLMAWWLIHLFLLFVSTIKRKTNEAG